MAAHETHHKNVCGCCCVDVCDCLCAMCVAAHAPWMRMVRGVSYTLNRHPPPLSHLPKRRPPTLSPLTPYIILLPVWGGGDLYVRGWRDSNGHLWSVPHFSHLKAKCHQIHPRELLGVATVGWIIADRTDSKSKHQKTKRLIYDNFGVEWLFGNKTTRWRWVWEGGRGVMVVGWFGWWDYVRSG